MRVLNFVNHLELKYVRNMEFTKENIRFYIWARLKLGDTPTAIHNQLQMLCGSECPSFSTVTRWFKDFQTGEREGINDRDRPGRPRCTKSEENIIRIRDMINKDKRLTVREMEDSTGIPKSSIHEILQDHLKLKKLCARWVPHIFSPEQKQQRVAMAQQLIPMLNDKHLFWVTGDESWFMFHQMQSKLQNVVWIGDDEERPQVARSSFRSRKRMFTIFISRTDVELIDVLQEGQHINATYYRDFILDPLVKTLRQRQGPRRIVVHHDNASSHTALSVQQFLQSKNVIVAPHAPYSPDLAPLDF